MVLPAVPRQKVLETSFLSWHKHNVLLGTLPEQALAKQGFLHPHTLEKSIRVQGNRWHLQKPSQCRVKRKEELKPKQEGDTPTFSRSPLLFPHALGLQH